MTEKLFTGTLRINQPTNQYTNFVMLESPMLHFKFHDNRSSDLEARMIFTIYEFGGHLGHETWTSYTNFRPTLSKGGSI